MKGKGGIKTHTLAISHQSAIPLIFHELQHIVPLFLMLNCCMMLQVMLCLTKGT